MNFILSLVIGKYAKFFWPAVALVIVYLYWDGRNDTIADLTKKNNDLQAELVIRKQEYESNLATMQNSLDDQNNKIDVLNQQLVLAEQDAEQKIAVVNTENQALSEKLQDQLELINNIETPKTCQAAIDLAVDVAIQHKWPTER